MIYSTPSATQIELTNCTQVNSILSLLNQRINDFDVISLDCFDTLVHRLHQNPTDHFFHLPLFLDEENKNYYHHHAHFRISAEQKARKKKFIQEKKHEVNLLDIYEILLENQNVEQYQDYANQELMVDIQYAYFNRSWLDLFSFAKKNGKKIILISDTYYSQSQIKNFLSLVIKEFTADEIFDEIFVSSECGISKSEGLMGLVSRKLKIDPKKMLHIGDHPISDFLSAKRNLSHAILWKGFSDSHQEIFRLEKAIFKILNPQIKEPFKEFYKSVHQLENADSISPIDSIAKFSLTPLLVLFDQHIYSCHQTAKSKKNSIKLIFLLRDGYLSSKIYSKLHPDELVYAASISRSTSISTSFYDEEDILEHLQEVGFSEPELALKQFLFENDEIRNFLNGNDDSDLGLVDFIKRNKNKILSRSMEMRSRFYAYLSKIGIQSGDHLLFVDLGYSGTSHFKLKKTLIKFGVTYESIFLIALNHIKTDSAISGWIDGRDLDFSSMDLLVTYVAMLEKLCSCISGSVIDYDSNGNPILKNSQHGKNQIEVTNQIQESVLNYCLKLNETYLPFSQLDKVLYSMTCLGRLLFFPTRSEINVLDSFLFDMNLNTDKNFSLFNIHEGISSLNKRGMSYIERNLKNIKMNLPIELKSIHLELSFFLIMQHRLGLEFSPNDFSYLKKDISLLIINGEQITQLQIEAKATFNDYYSLMIPVLTGDEQFGLALPFSGSIIEIYAIEKFPSQHYLSNEESVFTEPVQYHQAISELKEILTNIYFCQSDDAIFSIKPINTKSGDQIRVTFRVIKSNSTEVIL